ncbi:DUF1646 family protein [Bacillus sp. 31A1R]|uniref:DUF1646 family protein n=1 Tax=Robertmurraya mangrovi TaxID=3098077 RepID=A0ABU5IZQ1_9BACI|nr:DUF1646 family protein [Bacillus sp. 31A1R]MDZ5472635.1 DUF1646 family protein [Bacillus sp. 31A1R]
MVIGLIIVFLLVLLLPLILKNVEHNLEQFLFAMGLVAALISGVLDQALFLEAATSPINITIAVFIAGLFFKWFYHPLEKAIIRISKFMPYRIFIGLTVILLGLISSMITAIIAALVLVLIVTVLKLERRTEIRFVVLACFSIGLGAALTPLGEPLSTIAISKLNGDFFLLLRLIGPQVLIALTMFGILATLLVHPPKRIYGEKNKTTTEGYEEIFARALKIYFFVMGLTFLGAGFEPLIQQYFLGMNPQILYWINMISAVLDNATLTATEVSPTMSEMTIKAILLGLLISGGMLIPGNIPNIIAAGKLKISSKEWASFGVPVGLLTMLIYYIAIFFIL